MSTDVRPRLSFLEICGKPYDVGLQLGRFSADIVNGHLVKTHSWARVMSFRGHAVVAAAKALAEARFPRYLQELAGLADGLGLSFDDVFAWNCRGDVWAMAPDGCTTVQLPGEHPILAHNEDGDPGLRRGCALAHIRSEGGKAFTAFVYPGSLPGHAFGVNEAGLVQTVNNIRSQGTGPGTPRMMLTRALLDCSSIEGAVRLIADANRAGAFHVSLAQAGDPRIVSMEFTHANCSVEEISGPRCHANHLTHIGMRTEEQIVTASSRSRQERGDEMIRISRGHGIDPLAILRDRTRRAYPIHREQPDDPDGENTLATAVFEIGPQAVSWRVYTGVGESPCFSAEDGLVPCR